MKKYSLDEINSDVQLLEKIKEVDGAGSGLDADLLRGLPADFTNSLSSPGYQKLPSGLIVQFGKSTTGTDGTDVAFPIAFPSSVSGLLATHNGSGIDSYVAQTSSLSTTGFTVHGWKAGTELDMAYGWLAIGY